MGRLPASMDEDRVAAMSAACSLGERAAEGLGRGALNQVYVEKNGTVFDLTDDEAVQGGRRQGRQGHLMPFRSAGRPRPWPRCARVATRPFPAAGPVPQVATRPAYDQGEPPSPRLELD
jgi:hypothetical protein